LEVSGPALVKGVSIELGSLNLSRSSTLAGRFYETVKANSIYCAACCAPDAIGAPIAAALKRPQC
jgi:hypothetical protein